MPGALLRFWERLRVAVWEALVPPIVPPPVRAVGPDVGPLAHQHLEALADVLDEHEWAQVQRVGRVEHGLRDAHASLRELSLRDGRAARAAESLRRDIDVLLSHPNGDRKSVV